jgi:NTP pyrophosphatase (non-canonical NTP hydrolase)
MSDSFLEWYEARTEDTALYEASIRKWVQNASQDDIVRALCLAYETLGYVGEAGEVANKVKKILRDRSGELDSKMAEDIIDECGDGGWYLARLVRRAGSVLEVMFRRNADKLADRKNRGMLGGAGDRR